jgi:hypothetical protein
MMPNEVQSIHPGDQQEDAQTTKHNLENPDEPTRRQTHHSVSQN